MKPDLLDDLRRADPVDREALEVPSRLAARALDRSSPGRGRRRPARTLSVLATVAAAAAVGAVLLLAHGHSPDLASRAYAAVSAPGIVHWRTDVATSANGRPPVRQRVEGWSLGAATHTLFEDVIHGKPHVTMDVRTVGRRSRAWMSASDDWSSMTLPKGVRPIEMIPSGDPLAAFRRAYRAGRLRDLGHGRFEVTFRHLAVGTVVYDVDPATGRPLRLTITNVQPAMPGRPGTRTVTTVTFSVYETLAVTPDNRAKLELLPHQGAGAGREDPARYFAGLRTGARVTGADGAQVRSLARHMTRFHIDPEGVRPVSHGVWLLPGRGYICLAVATPPSAASGRTGVRGGVGAGCVTVRKALQTGVSVGTVARGSGEAMQVTLAVPDGVTAIKARRYWRGHWRRFPVTGGLVRLPGLSWQVRLVR